MRTLWGSHLSPVCIIFNMTHLRSTDSSRTLTVVLSESDWQALRAVEPDAVGWLHAQIRQRLSCAEQRDSQAGARPAVAAGASWGDDVY
jgi:hypothetical protein